MISFNMRLSNIDGFGGILSAYSVEISSNRLLCHILDQNPSTTYWEVNMNVNNIYKVCYVSSHEY